MIVCVCRRVSDRDIQRHASGGCADFETLQMETGLATSCGRCESCARDIWQRASSTGSVALISAPDTLPAAARSTT